MTKDLIILRGLPGSGKTTFANLIGDVVCSADDFFTNSETNEYKWTQEHMGAAHLWCKLNVKRNMILGTERIIVANTHTQLKEFNDYMEMAKEFGYRYFVLVVENYNETTNVHNVPDAALTAMKERFTTKLI